MLAGSAAWLDATAVAALDPGTSRARMRCSFPGPGGFREDGSCRVRVAISIRAILGCGAQRQRTRWAVQAGRGGVAAQAAVWLATPGRSRSPGSGHDGQGPLQYLGSSAGPHQPHGQPVASAADARSDGLGTDIVVDLAKLRGRVTLSGAEDRGDERLPGHLPARRRRSPPYAS